MTSIVSDSHEKLSVRDVYSHTRMMITTATATTTTTTTTITTTTTTTTTGTTAIATRTRTRIPTTRTADFVVNAYLTNLLTNELSSRQIGMPSFFFDLFDWLAELETDRQTDKKGPKGKIDQSNKHSETNR